MPGGGTSSFTDPDDYQTGFREAKIDLVVTCRGDFKARLTWVELRHLHLLRAQENLPCIAYVSLAPGPVFVAFPTHADAGPIWGGVKLQSGDIVLHSRGERTHQRTSAASHWGFVSLAPEHLAYYGRSLTGRALVPPPAARILRPAPPAAMRLLHLHAEAGRLARTTPDIIAHPEVARALEQDLLHALINCLTVGDARGDAAPRRLHASIMVRFEEALAQNPDRPLHIPEVCAAIGVPEWRLRICCAEFLGMGPGRYLRLRRLNLVRAALRRADPAAVSVAELARRYGFAELGRFAEAYRTAFGETPSRTLQRGLDRRP